MPKAPAFGKALTELRAKRGFKTPYSFFRARDRARGLGMTFANYLALERGRSLPVGWRLERLLSALGVTPASPDGRRLLFAFAEAHLGSPALAEALAGGEGRDPAPAGVRLAETASRQAIGERQVQLSLEQYRVIARDQASYACWVLLKTCGPGFPVKELARRARVPQGAVDKALKALAAAGLVTVSRGRAACPYFRNFITPPGVTPATASVFAALSRHRDSWLKAHGRTVRAPYLLFRAPARALESYLEHLSEAVNMASLYADNSSPEGSEVYLVEARVSKLFEP